MAGHHEVLGGADVEVGSACASAALAPHPSFTACVAMLALLEVSTPLLNLVVFPLYDQTFSAARDISVLAMAVLLMGVALVATAAPRLLMTKRMSQMSWGALSQARCCFSLRLRGRCRCFWSSRRSCSRSVADG